ncbi:MAG: hypothetical protein KIT57_05925 [Blastocatellales bacterium]|nr:hypothetical protein [Nitrospira sp.]MCW5968031.1 hypothetical protein [Blastocatellales bacterium]
MWIDPIVKQTRNIRDKLAAKFNYDVEQLGRYYQSRQAAEGLKVVNRSAKKVEKEKEY